MRLKVSETGVMFWRHGQLIWDDYVHHEQFALRPRAEAVLRAFSNWREWHEPLGESIPSELEGIPNLPLLISQLLEAGVLVAEGSEASAMEERLRHWDTWHAAKYYHFASRTLSWTATIPGPEDAARLAEKAARTPPPSIYKEYPKAAAVPLPSGPTGPDGSDSLTDVLLRRRSIRAFDGSSSLSLLQLGRILHLTGGGREVRTRGTGPLLLKTSPSGGARHPIELYPCVLRVDGMLPGYYHYQPRGHVLELIRSGVDVSALIDACAGQSYVAEACVVLFYGASVDRTMWKYDTARAYRALLIDLGHLSQTLYLVVTWMKLGPLFVGTLRDEVVEGLFELDPAHDLVLGASAVGVIGADGRERTYSALTGEGTAFG
jgi:SagB-type dehydrogenase family enzyme